MTGFLTTKKGRKNYFVVLNVYDEGGKRKRKWIDTGILVEGHNKRKANGKLVEILAEYGKSGVDLTRDDDFVPFIQLWLETLRPNISPVTYEGYKYALKSHVLPYFEQKRLKVTQVTPAVVQKYVNHKLNAGLSANTVLKHLANISKCLDSAVRQNIIAYNPVKRIDLPKKVRYTGAKHYNEKQIEQLLECAKGDPLEIVIRLALFYGLRRSEVLGLKWGAIDFENRTLSICHTVITKGGKMFMLDRTKNDSSNAVFPMPDIIISILTKWKEQQQTYRALQPNDYHDSDYVCTKPNGELISPDYVTQHFTVLLKQNNMPKIRFHDLRHSSANFLRSIGFDMKDIQAWLRHKDIQTTMNIYVNLDLEAKTNIGDALNAKFELLDVN